MLTMQDLVILIHMLNSGITTYASVNFMSAFISSCTSLVQAASHSFQIHGERHT
jgi:hypothetical protein